MSETITDNYYALYIYLDTFWRRRYVIAISILLTPIFVLLSSMLLPKSYEANIAIAINNLAPPSMKDISSITDISEEFAGLQEYLRSPKVLKEVIIKSKLLKPDASELDIQQASQELRKSLIITLLEKSGIRISLIQNSPNYLTSILNALGDSLIKQLEFQNSSATRSSTIVLENQLNQQKQIVNESRDALNNFQNSHADLLPAYGNIYIARLRELATDRGDAEALYHSLLVEIKELNGILLKMNPALGQIENAIRENENKLGALRLIYTDNFPGVKAAIQFGQSLKAERDKLNKQYQKTDENTIQRLWNMIIAAPGNKNHSPNQALVLQLEKLNDMQIKIKGLEQKIAVLKNEQDVINKKLRLVGDTSQTLLKFTQAFKNNQNIYQDLQSRYNITKMTASMNSHVKSINFQIVASPQKPISSKAKPFSFFLITGVFAGIFLGFGIAIILEYMDNTVRYKQDLEELTNLKVICRVEKMSAV